MSWRAVAVPAKSSRLHPCSSIGFTDRLELVARPTYRNYHGSGLEICYCPSVVGQDCRERLIDATLSLCIRCGYEATTIDQIAADAGVAPSDFTRYFASKDAVVMSIVEDLLRASAAALMRVDKSVGPEQALLFATTAVMTAITDGSGVITQDRMLAMSQLVIAKPSLRKQASTIRKRVLTPALADRLGVAPDNRRVRQAVTVWSAIATGAYVSGTTMGDHYDPGLDDELGQRMVAELTASFNEVMGDGPAAPR
jgi:AcrR family transcriptional regulator